MDGSRFDSLTRSLTLAGSRRRALRGVLAGTLGVLGWHDGDETVAHDLKAKCKKKSGTAKKKCLKKAKQHNATHTTLPPPLTCGTGQKACGGSCIPSNQCCLDADCPAALPHCCAGACVVASQCCTDAQCTGGKTCQQATCKCPADKPKECAGICRPQCCSKIDCTNLIGPDTPECSADGVCTCAHRLCFTGQNGLCGICCSHAECPPNFRCTTSVPLSYLLTCQCLSPNSLCDGSCVRAACETECFKTCNTAGRPSAGQPCCDDLTCQPAPSQGDPNQHRCLPVF